MNIEPDLIKEATKRISQAVSRLAPLGLDVRYAVSVNVVPGSAPETLVPVLVVVLTVPHVIIGERAFTNLVTYDIHLSPESAEEIVQVGLANLDQALAQASSIVQVGTV